MPEFYGPLQHVSLAGTLWLILAFPFAAALFCVLYPYLSRGASERAAGAEAESRRRVTIVSVAAVALSFGVSLCHVVLLATRPEGERFLLQHLWRMVRVGQLDASFDLALDPLSSVMVLVITGVGTLIFVYTAAYMEKDDGFARFFAWMNLFVFAMLLLVLSDNLLLMFFGWEGVGLCSWGLIGFWWSDPHKATAGLKAFVVNRIGDAGFLLGVAALFWGLGGSWSESDYTPDLNARFSSVAVSDTEPDDAEDTRGARAPAPPRTDREHDREADDHDDAETFERRGKLPPTTGKGLLTLTSYAGALVFVDDARVPLMRAPGEPLYAPFARFPIPGGIHSFRIHAGAGLDDYLVTHVAMGEGREVALTLFGPTVTFRHVRDQLAARDARGQTPFKAALVAKRAWGRVGVITFACLLLFVGAIGKSAQIPLYVWLPDAMAGPTPTSALIHAATMVTAGVYMVARLGFLFVLSPTASTVVACVGAATALFAAAIALFQYDIKKVLAYSTVSQLGFMMLGVGAGAYQAGVFHLVTHAFFKACLFLAAGSVIHGMQSIEPGPDGAQDLRNMGGLSAKMPRTARAYFIACLAITAAPFPGLGGFWSKHEILLGTVASPILRVPGLALFAVALLAAGLTSFYMWRSYFLAFDGPPRPDAGKVHESPRRMTGVLAALAGLSAVSGAVLGLSPKLFGAQGESLLQDWLDPVLGSLSPAREAGIAREWGMIALSVAVALAGWSLARARYGATRPADWEERERRAPLHDLIQARFHVDAIYEHTFLRGTLALRDLVVGLDHYVVDGLVNAAAVFTRAAAWMVGRADSEIVDGAVNALAEGTLHAGRRVRAAQTGRIQSYVYAIVLGVLAVALLQYLLR
jgi:NADH-quinone oxidoreductase subunit L